jgi:hypothetical protein
VAFAVQVVKVGDGVDGAVDVVKGVVEGDFKNLYVVVEGVYGVVDVL